MSFAYRGPVRAGGGWMGVDAAASRVDVGRLISTSVSARILVTVRFEIERIEVRGRGRIKCDAMWCDVM